jgi:hypothetical protein
MSAAKRTALLATIPLAAMLGAALLAPSTAAACPTGRYCTDDNGTYELSVGPFPTVEPYLQYRDCVWHVYVDFGDGRSGEYTFEADKRLSDSHTYSEYKRYTVTFTTSDGYHRFNPGKPCPNRSESFFVYYQSPEEIEEEARLTQEQKEAREKKEAEELAAIEAMKQKEREEREAREQLARERLSGGGSGPEGTSGGGQKTPPSFWLGCRGRIQVHGLGCAKARRVIGHARRKNLIEDGPRQILGFSCRVPETLPARISCRDGKRRILASL